jgi:hypothetical protein
MGAIWPHPNTILGPCFKIECGCDMCQAHGHWLESRAFKWSWVVWHDRMGINGGWG